MLTIGRTTRTAFACYFRNVAKHLRYSHKDFYVKYKDSFYEKNGHHEANVTIDPVYAAIFNDVSHIAQKSLGELASVLLYSQREQQNFILLLANVDTLLAAAQACEPAAAAAAASSSHCDDSGSLSAYP